MVAFAEEEGARFGVACLGSRLLTGTLFDPDRRAAAGGPRRPDLGPRRWARPAADLGRRAGPRCGRLEIGAFVELHVEQGRALVDLDAPGGCGVGDLAARPVAVATSPARPTTPGTTRMSDRHDPMLTFAYTVLAANKEARLADAHATIGTGATWRPNATNAIAAEVTAWLDARAPQQPTLERTRHRHPTAGRGAAPPRRRSTSGGGDRGVASRRSSTSSTNCATASWPRSAVSRCLPTASRP